MENKDFQHFQQIIEKAGKVYEKNFDRKCWFERAVFLSWYCSRADCKFCEMSALAPEIKIKNPKLARRRSESILAEILFARMCGWRMEFLSGGYDCYSITGDEKRLLNLIEQCSKIYGKKIWLNIGNAGKEFLASAAEFVEGVCGSVETVNQKIREYACPSKPIAEIEDLLKKAEQLGLKRAMTIIIGLGENIDDIEKLFALIRKHSITRITFYSLIPHKGTAYENAKIPKKEYYAKWIAKTRIEFPKLEIIAGIWVDRIEQIGILLNAGANAITKLPAIKVFGTKTGRNIEGEISRADRKFEGTLTMLNPEIVKNAELIVNNSGFEQELKQKIMKKFNAYLKQAKRKYSYD